MALCPAMWSTLALIAFHFHKEPEVAQAVLVEVLHKHYRLDDVSLLPDAATGRELHVLEGFSELRLHRDMVDAHSPHALMEDWVDTHQVNLQDEDSMK